MNVESASPAAQAIRPLTSIQERRLVEYLEDQFLQLTRGYKKRSEPTTHLPTLDAYLHSAQKILAMILQIPPVDPSTSLRTAFLLRLTNDVLTCIPGYPPSEENLPIALDYLDDLDQAWVSVLQAQIWDPTKGIGVDLVIDADDVAKGLKSSPLSQTECTRLKGLILGGVATMEEWVEGKSPGAESLRQALASFPEQDVQRMLQRIGAQEGFDELFSRTLDELGGLSMSVEPEVLDPMDEGF